MTASENSVKKYVVRLSGAEREQLEKSLGKGKNPARQLLKARILLKADVSDAGEGWSDNEIIRALGTSASMVYRVRKQLVEEGFEAVLSRKQRAMPAVARAGPVPAAIGGADRRHIPGGAVGGRPAGVGGPHFGGQFCDVQYIHGHAGVAHDRAGVGGQPDAARQRIPATHQRHS